MRNKTVVFLKIDIDWVKFSIYTENFGLLDIKMQKSYQKHGFFFVRKQFLGLINRFLVEKISFILKNAKQNCWLT